MGSSFAARPGASYGAISLRGTVSLRRLTPLCFMSPLHRRWPNSRGHAYKHAVPTAGLPSGPAP